jgi:hypothetical protein
MYCFIIPTDLALGDEMFLHRNVLFELVTYNIIDHQSIIVTNPDRFFLYNAYFQVAEKEDTTKKIVYVELQVPFPPYPYELIKDDERKEWCQDVGEVLPLQINKIVEELIQREKNINIG